MQVLKMQEKDGIKSLINRDYGMRHEYYECICDSEEHALRITYFVDEWNNIDEDEVYFSVHMEAPGGVWSRLKTAVKYLFGYDCKYGHFECTTIKRQDAVRFRDLMDRYIQSGLVEDDNSRSIKIVEKGDNYVITDKGVKVWLLADDDNLDYDKQEKPNE